MIDFFNLTDNSLNNQVFYANGTTSWQIWQKPNNAKFINILAIGGGGGGGAGGSNNAGAGGGGGGGSSAISRLFINSCVLPDRLYVQVGNGGRGGIQSPVSAATSGGISYVSVQPNTSSLSVVVASGNAGAGFGGQGQNGASPGTAGVAGAADSGSMLSQLGFYQTISGIIGQAGGPGSSILSSITLGVSPYILPITPGMGGSGLSAGGTPDSTGNIIGGGFIPTISGGTSNPTGGTQGSNGYYGLTPNSNSSSRSPFFSTGGAGGGAGGYSLIVGFGGTGGAGGYGCGGGGGGASYTTSTNGGRGGRGGDGLVIITCW